MKNWVRPGEDVPSVNTYQASPINLKLKYCYTTNLEVYVGTPPAGPYAVDNSQYALAHWLN